jgi:hypothetical protein
LLSIKQQGSRRVNIKGNLKGVPDMDVLNGELPGQKYLSAIPIWGEVGHIKASAATLNNGVGLAGIKDHHRPSGQRNAMTCR